MHGVRATIWKLGRGAELWKRVVVQPGAVHSRPDETVADCSERIRTAGSES